jgi:ketosteroid isomerase-like protein
MAPHDQGSQDDQPLPPVERAISALSGSIPGDDVFAEGCVSWHNFDQLDSATVPDAFDGLRWALTIAPDLRMEDVTSYIINDDVSVATYRLRGTLPDGHKLDAPIALFAFSRDGKVVRTEEYLDTAQSVNLFAKFGSDWAVSRIDGSVEGP